MTAEPHEREYVDRCLAELRAAAADRVVDAQLVDDLIAWEKCGQNGPEPSLEREGIKWTTAMKLSSDIGDLFQILRSSAGTADQDAPYLRLYLKQRSAEQRGAHDGREGNHGPGSFTCSR